MPRPILAALLTAVSSFAQAEEVMRVALVGQALIKSEVCTTAPAAFEQARGYLKGVDVAFTNLDVAIEAPGRQLKPRGSNAVPAQPVALDCLKSLGQSAAARCGAPPPPSARCWLRSAAVGWLTSPTYRRVTRLALIQV